jgi:hypothetical protein
VSTLTHTPAQSTFAQDFELNYPGDVRGIDGQVVGPNWMGEFFVIRETHTARRDGQVITVADLALLTKDRQALLSVEARRDFVAKVGSHKTAEAESGFHAVPEWSELRDAEYVITRPHLWLQEPPR